VNIFCKTKTAVSLVFRLLNSRLENVWKIHYEGNLKALLHLAGICDRICRWSLSTLYVGLSLFVTTRKYNTTAIYNHSETWLRLDWVDSFQPEGRGFDSRSSRQGRYRNGRMNAWIMWVGRWLSPKYRVCGTKYRVIYTCIVQYY